MDSASMFDLPVSAGLGPRFFRLMHIARPERAVLQVADLVEHEQRITASPMPPRSGAASISAPEIGCSPKPISTTVSRRAAE